jgi:hypothetical protein
MSDDHTTDDSQTSYKETKHMNDDKFSDYDKRAEATLAYRLLEYLAFRGVITDDDVAYLRYPPIKLIEDAEAAWDE